MRKVEIEVTKEKGGYTVNLKGTRNVWVKPDGVRFTLHSKSEIQAMVVACEYIADNLLEGGA